MDIGDLWRWVDTHDNGVAWAVVRGRHAVHDICEELARRTGAKAAPFVWENGARVHVFNIDADPMQFMGARADYVEFFPGCGGSPNAARALEECRRRLRDAEAGVLTLAEESGLTDPPAEREAAELARLRALIADYETALRRKDDGLAELRADLLVARGADPTEAAAYVEATNWVKRAPDHTARARAVLLAIAEDGGPTTTAQDRIDACRALLGVS